MRNITAYTLFSSSSGNCLYVKTPDAEILIDAGVSARAVEKSLLTIGSSLSNIRAIFVTHEHSDHIKGVGTAARKFKCPVVSTMGTYLGMSDHIGKVDHTPIKRGVGFTLGDIDILPIPTRHDAADPVCYRFSTGGKSAFIATDTGSINMEIRQAIKDSDLIVLESNYDPQRLRNNPLYPEYLKRRIASEDSGHLSNYQCGDALMSIRSGQRVFLGHLSKKNNDPDLAKDTVSQTSGIRRAALDCLDCNLDDTRALKI